MKERSEGLRAQWLTGLKVVVAAGLELLCQAGHCLHMHVACHGFEFLVPDSKFHVKEKEKAQINGL